MNHESLHLDARRKRRVVIFMIFVLLTVIGVARIVSGYAALSVTYDEREQVASGMEWLADGTYTYDVVHPPLSRLFAAIGPFLEGDIPHVPQAADDSQARLVGDAIFFGSDDPLHTIALARAGNLPFFVLASAVVLLLASSTVGDIAGVFALLLFTTLPPVLAHAGLATTDMAATAMTALAVFAFVRWMNNAAIPRSVALGMALGLAVVAKLSCVVFLPACMAVLTVWYLTIHFRTASPGTLQARRRSAGLTCALGVMLLVIWASYRFSFTMPLPAPEFLSGLQNIIEHNDQGHWSYLLGDVRQTGWWYFFPIAILVKTPLPLLFLSVIGGIAMIRRSWRERRWQLAVPSLCCIALMPVLAASRIDIGIRHALPIYCFLVIAAGYGVVVLCMGVHHRLVGATVVALLCGWQVISSFAWHPDYLAYFNELALLRRDPILIDSDLDWGQDFFRLSTALRERHIDHVAVALSGFRSCPAGREHDAASYHFPETTVLRPGKPETGWIAASYRILYVAEGYSWLLQLSPVARIGQSILLYHVDEKDISQLQPWATGRKQPVDPCEL